MSDDRASDPDFESDLFALYGQPSTHWGDGGVTRRMIAEITSDYALRRQIALLASVFVGLIGSALALALIFAPVINDLAVRINTMPALIWTTAAAVLLLLAAAATKLVMEE